MLLCCCCPYCAFVYDLFITRSNAMPLCYHHWNDVTSCTFIPISFYCFLSCSIMFLVLLLNRCCSALRLLWLCFIVFLLTFPLSCQVPVCYHNWNRLKCCLPNSQLIALILSCLLHCRLLWLRLYANAVSVVVLMSCRIFGDYPPRLFDCCFW